MTGWRLNVAWAGLGCAAVIRRQAVRTSHRQSWCALPDVRRLCRSGRKPVGLCTS